MVNQRLMRPWKHPGLTLTPKALSNQLLPPLPLNSEGTGPEGIEHPAWLLPPPSWLCEGTVTEGVAYTPRKSRCAVGTAGLPASVIDAPVCIISETLLSLPSSGVLHCPHPHYSSPHILCGSREGICSDSEIYSVWGLGSRVYPQCISHGINFQ